MKNKLTIVLTFAISVLILPFFTHAKSIVEGKYFSIELDDAFDRFLVDQVPMEGTKPLATSLFIGKYNSMELRIWVSQIDVGKIEDKDLDKALKETVKGAFDGVSESFKKDYPNSTLTYDKINTTEKYSAIAREIIFHGSFGGQKIEGFSAAIYKNDKITILMGGAVGLKSEFSNVGTRIIDASSTSLKIHSEKSEFAKVNNNDFTIILPAIITLKIQNFTEENLREYEFTGSTDNIDMAMMLAVADANEITDKSEIDKLLRQGVSTSLKEVTDELKLSAPQSQLKIGEAKSFKANNHPGIKQGFTIQNGSEQMKGEVRMVYTVDKVYVIITRTLNFSGKPDSVAASSLIDSVDSLITK